MIELVPLTKRLSDQLKIIEIEMLNFLNTLTIHKTWRDPDGERIFGPIYTFLPTHHWGELNDKQRLMQLHLLKLYNAWSASFHLLLSYPTEEIKNQIEEIDSLILSTIERKSPPSPTIEED